GECSMIDITKLTAEKLEEIRQRYRPTLAPKCHICGVEMTIQRMSASRITYGCAGAIYDETGCHYAEGRSLADDHYAESRITVVDVSDPDVLAMVEALEKAQAENTAGVAGMAESYETTISMLRSRIAELESRTVTVKLPQAVSAGGQGYQEQVERILTAAGIKVEAE
ncbi:ead/Ea22-like family protein, partial [Escherichia coli]|uniref:ead/Ea22-like family protein n=2 Tax=Enterobacterales TaxID=91347 RepID=UPI003EBF7894